MADREKRRESLLTCPGFRLHATGVDLMPRDLFSTFSILPSTSCNTCRRNPNSPIVHYRRALPFFDAKIPYIGDPHEGVGVSIAMEGGAELSLHTTC